MTIIEKMYAGEKLDEEELRYLAVGFAWGLKTEPGEYEVVDEVEGDSDGSTQKMETIIKTGDDLWCVPWEQGLEEYRWDDELPGYTEDEFCKQPYKVERKERLVTEVYYEKMEGLNE